MSAAKTQPSTSSVDAYLAARASPEQLADCKALLALLQDVTDQPPTMWGASMVGFGRYAYKYDSGRSGEFFTTGFAVRGKDLVVYLVAPGVHQAEHLARLGKHKTGKSCLYIKRLADVDTMVLRALVAESVAEIRRLHPGAV